MTKVSLRHTMNSIDPSLFGSSLRWCSIEIRVLKSFANFTEKYLCWGLFLIKTFLAKKKPFWRRDDAFSQCKSAFALAIVACRLELGRLYIYSIYI